MARGEKMYIKTINKIMFILLVIIMFPNISYGYEEVYLKGQVQSIEQVESNEIFEKSIVEIKILEGEMKEEVLYIEHYTMDNPAYDMPINEGDKVMIVELEGDGETMYAISDYYRAGGIKSLVILFSILLIIVGRTKGIKTIISLVITLYMTFNVFIPMIIRGYNVIGAVILVSAAVVSIVIPIMTGFSLKSLSTILGTLFGVIAAGTIAAVVGGHINLTGMSSEEAVMLMYSDIDTVFNFTHLLFAGILLGALGAVMDVCMSISSAMQELFELDSTLKFKDLFKSGMNIGTDIMGTMANTLILAYVGGSLSLVLLFAANGVSFDKIINLDMVATEIVRSIAGSIGLVLAVPFTSLVMALLLSHFSDRNE